jgi:hypothetical protein
MIVDDDPVDVGDLTDLYGIYFNENGTFDFAFVIDKKIPCQKYSVIRFADDIVPRVNPWTVLSQQELLGPRCRLYRTYAKQDDAIALARGTKKEEE